MLETVKRVAVLILLLLPATVSPSRAAEGACVPDPQTLCLDANRFAVTAFFQPTPTGPSLPATAVSLTDDSGYFWFFDPTNAELVVKVLDGCAISNAYWVFAAGLTNVDVEITVTDTRSQISRQFHNPTGTPFQAIQDTQALPTCP